MYIYFLIVVQTGRRSNTLELNIIITSSKNYFYCADSVKSDILVDFIQ